VDAIILTVFNRPQLTLVNTLNALSKCNLADTTILVVDDGSDTNDDLHDVLITFDSLPIVTKRTCSQDLPGAYAIGGHTNPAAANNLALDWCKENGVSRIFWLSSDCIVPPSILDKARQLDLDKYVYVPSTMDIDTSKVFCGKDRQFPMCWFVGTTLAACEKAGRFDENYLKGMGFEDNDFMARLCASTGRLVLDVSTWIFHQSHEATYYSDEGVGYKRSKDYTLQKWGGIPWSYEADDPIRWNAKEVGRSLIGKVEWVNAAAKQAMREQVGV
jgi:hypothetical protein